MNKLKYYFTHWFSVFAGVFFALSILSLDLVHAQSSERFQLDYLHLGDSNDVSTSGVSGSYSHRMFLDKEGSNLLTLSLSATRVELMDEALTGPDRDRQLTSLVPEVNLLKVLSEKYSLVATLRPGFHGDLQGSLSDEFRLEGGVVLTRFVNANLTLGLGLGRGTNFGRDLVVPLFQFLYFATDKILIRGVLPVEASLWYIPSQKWEFGFLYRLRGGVFHLDETNINGAERVGLAAAQVGFGARYNLAGNNFITAEFGYTALRRYQWDDERGTSLKISEDPFLERDLDPVPFIGVGFIQKF